MKSFVVSTKKKDFSVSRLIIAVYIFGSHQSQTIERIKALNDMYNCILIISEKKGLETLHISNFYTDRFSRELQTSNA